MKTKEKLLAASVAALMVAFTACQSQGTVQPPVKQVETTENQAEKTKDEKIIKNTNEKPAEDVSTAEDLSSKEFAENVQKRVEAHWPHMSEVWPDHDYEKHNLILFHVDENGEPKVAWNINTKGVNQVDLNKLDIEVPFPGSYSQITYENKKSIAMSIDDEMIKNLDKSSDELYKKATHELVHFYYQDEHMESSRVANYPLDKTPRLYRKMIMDNLVKAYKNTDESNKYLSQAKYWYDKWTTEYSDEYNDIKGTDIDEGTARYVENIGSFIKPGLSKEEFKKNAIKLINMDEDFVTADAESYDLGYVTALMLDQKNPNWKDDFYKSKKSLEELLFKDVEPLKQEVDPDIEKKVTESIESFNSEVSGYVSNITKAIDDKSVPYLKINNDENSVFGSGISISYKEHSIITNYTTNMEVNGKNIDIKGLSLIDDFNDESSSLLVPLDMEYKIENEELTIDSEKLKVDGVKVKTEKDESGRTIFVVQK